MIRVPIFSIQLWASYILGFAFILTISSQDSFEWIDKGTSKRWTDPKNWNPNGDPDGAVTVVFPKGSKPTLDADRTVGLLDMRGVSGQAVTITGSQKLQTQIGLNWDEAVLIGSGTFIAGGVATFEGKVDFGNWEVRLPQGGNIRNGNIRMAGNRFLINGSLNAGPGFAGVNGTGQLEILGSVNIQNTPESGLDVSQFSGAKLSTRIRGSIHVENGIHSILNATIASPDSKFSTGPQGELLIRTDFLELNNAQFNNDNRLEIQVTGTGNEDSIVFQGALIAGGGNPTTLRGLTIQSSNAQFQSMQNGAWKFSGNHINGAAQNEGSFIWASGDLNKKPPGAENKPNSPAFVNLARKPNELQIESDGNTRFPISLSGHFINRGNVVQRTDLTIQEKARLSVVDGGVWELTGEADIKGFVDPREKTLFFEKGSLLRYLGTNPNTKGAINVSSSFTNARIEVAAGQVELNQPFDMSQTEIIFHQADSKVLINGNGAVDGLTMNFNQRNRVRISHELKEFFSNFLPFPQGNHVFISNGGVKARGRISARGNGSLLIDSGTLLVGPAGATLEFEGSSDLEESGAFLEIAKSGGSGKPAIALFSEFLSSIDSDADASDRRIRKPFLNLMATTLFREGSVETLPVTFPDRTIPSEAGVRGTIENKSGNRLEILSGKVKILRNINLENEGSILHAGQSGNWLQLEFATLSNADRYELLGDGDIRFRGDIKKTCFINLGTLEKTGGTGTSTISVPLENRGNVAATTGTLQINQIKGLPENADTLNGGQWTVAGEGKIRFLQLSSIKKTEDVSLKISGKQANFLNKNGQPIFRPTQPIELKQNSRITLEEDAVLPGSQVDIGNQAQLGGTGVIDSPKTTVSDGGKISPGTSPGQLTITGDFEMQPGAIYAFEAGAQAQDLLIIQGNAKLGGIFEPGFIGNFRPAPGTRFTVLQAASIDGTFDRIEQSVLLAAGISLSFIYSDTRVEAVVEPSQPDHYSQWAEGSLETTTWPAEARLPDADPDSDGIPNVMEFALGMDPTQSSAFPVSVKHMLDDDNQSAFMLELPRDKRSIAYRLFIEGSKDLSQWSRLDFVMESSDISNELETQQLLIDFPDIFSNLAFIRIGIEINLNPHQGNTDSNSIP